MPDRVDTAVLLSRLDRGERLAARDLLPVVYEELRALAERQLRGERAGHTLQPTALVHEVFLKLAGQTRVEWQGRTHFMAVAAEAMRRLLVDHARARATSKRGGAWQRVGIDDLPGLDLATPPIDLIALDEALDKLAALDTRQSHIVTLRYFGGLTWDEIAHVVECSRPTVTGDWTAARAWLIAELDGPASPTET